MFPDQLTKALMLPTRGHFIGIDRNNRLFTFVFALFPGLLASGTSVTLVLAFIWALISLADKDDSRFELTQAGQNCRVVYNVLCFGDDFLGRVHPNPAKGGPFLIKMIPFLADLGGPAAPSCRHFGAIDTVLDYGRRYRHDRLAYIQHRTSRILVLRAEGGAGNAAVFGLFAVLFGSISLLNAHSDSKTERVIAITGFACGMVCAFLSGTRSAWLVMPLNFIVLYWYLRGQSLPTITNAAKVVGTVWLSPLLR